MADTVFSSLSLHDALPICVVDRCIGIASYQLFHLAHQLQRFTLFQTDEILLVSGNQISQHAFKLWQIRSEEHTSELQSRRDLVCRLLLEKKKRRRCVFQIE